ncbi:hypothetical protein Dsin_017178 [Dipteronia sinensis]|uniref:Uncharacterized protein n=1 Tax=Dipteronia sinensis TaxID=43782 RepID=A0AAE0AFR8_9ROSI|nr:hypothetical protein Dsin_017178 [Dipteronia sinensis]
MLSISILKHRGASSATANVEPGTMVSKRCSNADHEGGEKSGDLNRSKIDGGNFVCGGSDSLYCLSQLQGVCCRAVNSSLNCLFGGLSTELSAN